MVKMKAIQIYAPGGVDVLRYEDVERPEPQAGEVVVRVHAAGINPIDTISRAHPLPLTTGKANFPYILGWDIAGEVVEVGEGVTQFVPGDAVYGMIRFPQEGKAYSEYVSAPVEDLARKPVRLTYQEAAGVPAVALTVWQDLFDIAHLQAGQTVFIAGGAGGCGHIAVQLAKWKGAKVISTTSTRNVDFVRQLGADVVIDYTQQSFVEHVKEVDVVLDTIGGEVLRQAFQVVKRGGIVVSLPGHTNVQAIGDELAPRYGVAFVFTPVHPSGTQLAEITSLFDAGQLNVHIDGVFPLQEVAQAHTLSEGGHVRGKLVLNIE
ncbi:MAG TPA: NADP-dependent oxidoreductase [Ktedonobacteraceae bacterium]|nr:NADP-dependent oxidoreductase [Ktedonobacteraceae bacterium]